MDIVVDTSALLAVILAEPERDGIVQATAGHELIGPGSIRWEVGNAFSAMLKQRRAKLREVKRGLAIFGSIPLREIEVDLENVLEIADQAGVYAYDAYFLAVSVRRNAPLLTLDRTLARTARKLGVRILEV